MYAALKKSRQQAFIVQGRVTKISGGKVVRPGGIIWQAFSAYTRQKFVRCASVSNACVAEGYAEKRQNKGCTVN